MRTLLPGGSGQPSDARLDGAIAILADQKLKRSARAGSGLRLASAVPQLGREKGSKTANVAKARGKRAHGEAVEARLAIFFVSSP